MSNDPFYLQEIDFSCVLKTVSIKVAKIGQTKVKIYKCLSNHLLFAGK